MMLEFNKKFQGDYLEVLRQVLSGGADLMLTSRPCNL
jgi:hypothetical protein